MKKFQYSKTYLRKSILEQNFKEGDEVDITLRIRGEFLVVPGVISIWDKHLLYICQDYLCGQTRNWNDAPTYKFKHSWFVCTLDSESIYCDDNKGGTTEIWKIERRISVILPYL